MNVLSQKRDGCGCISIIVLSQKKDGSGRMSSSVRSREHDPSGSFISMLPDILAILCFCL